MVPAHDASRRKRSCRPILLAPVAACLLWPQVVLSQQPDSAALAQGLSLLSRLSSHAADPAADAATFRQVGTDTSQKSLLAVVGKGMSRDATAEDWANMHRAYDALVELYVGEQQLLKAGIFAGLQDS